MYATSVLLLRLLHFKDIDTAFTIFPMKKGQTQRQTVILCHTNIYFISYSSIIHPIVNP